MTAKHPQTEQLLQQAKCLRSMARALVGNRAEAEDLVQDTLVLALEAPPALHDGIGPWLRGVLRNKVSHLQRSSQSRARREQASARQEALPPTVDLVARRGQLAVLVEELLSLKEPYQTVLYLRFFEDKGPGEIASELGVSAGTIASQVSRGLDLLRARLDSRSGGDREVWISALLPWFAGDSGKAGLGKGVVWMASSAKLLGSALVLGCLILYVSLQEPAASEWHALTPQVETVAAEGRSVQPDEPPVPMQEEGRTPPARSPLAVETAEPGREVAVRGLAEEPIGSLDAPEPTSIPTKPAPQPPALPSSGWQGRKVQRNFEMHVVGVTEFSPELTTAAGIAGLPGHWEWSYDSELTFTDNNTSALEGPRPSFERTLVGDWSVDLTETFLSESVFGGKSPLEHRVQVFQPHETEERYVVQLKHPQETDDRAWLQGLDAVLDLPQLAPPEDWSAGTEWSAPLAALTPLFFPGGDLHVEYEDSSPVSIFNFTSLTDTRQTGSKALDAITCRLTSLEGQPLGDPEFVAFQITLVTDPNTIVKPHTIMKIGETDPPHPMQGWHLAVVGKGSGTGRWNLEHQRIDELELDSEWTIALGPGSTGPGSPHVPHAGQALSTTPGARELQAVAQSGFSTTLHIDVSMRAQEVPDNGQRVEGR